MEIKKTVFKNLLEIKFKKYQDLRGSFIKIFNKSNSKKFKNNCHESYLSISKKGSFRGLHAQTGKYAQDKIIYCAMGKIIDVAVDLRKSSKTFGKYVGLIISAKSDFSFYIPEGFAHGFLCLSKECVVNYKCSQYRDASTEKTINWNDKKINIKWPVKRPMMSEKDKKIGLSLDEYNKINN